MFEHPYLSHQLTAYDHEQIERAAAQRRMLIEHADRIVRRPEGAVRRMLRRVLRGSDTTGRTSGEAARDAAPVRGLSGRAASGRENSGCEPAAASAR